MKTFNLSINCDNDAFGDDPAIEIARILDELARRTREHGLPDYTAPLRDINGNNVGSICWVDRE